MKKILILLSLLLFNISTSQASIYYYASLSGIVDAPDSGMFCDVELGNCTYSDIGVNLSFSEDSTYLELGVEATLSYSISGADADSVSLSIVSDNEELMPSSALVINTTNEAINIPASAINQSGEVRIVLQAKDINGEVVAQDYTYLNIETISSKNMLTIWSVSAEETVQFPFSASFTNKYDGHIDWGDGSGIETFTDTKIQDLSHTYIEAGTYEIRIDGGFYDEDSFLYMFYGVSIPSSMDISQWDVSNVEDLSWTFQNSIIPTGFDINSWDISSSINIWGTFYGANLPPDFNINSWDSSNVQRMYMSFYNVTLPASFNISSWDISNVNEMRGLFYNTKLQGDLDLSSWDFSSLASINSIFNNVSIAGNIIYNQSVLNSTYKSFLQLLANPSASFPNSFVSKKIVAGDNACAEDDNECILARKAVIAKGWVIEDATVDTGLVIDKATALESRWTVSAGEEVQFPLYYIYSGIIDWGDGTIEEFTDLRSNPHTYAEAGTYTIWMNGSWGNNLSNMFYNQTIPSGLDISAWNMYNISSVNEMFGNSQIPTGFNINSWDMSNVQSMHLIFQGVSIPTGFNINSWDVSGLSDNSYLWGIFKAASLPRDFDISSWDISNVKNLGHMLYGASTSDNFDISLWDVSNVESIHYMFYNTRISDNFNFGGWDLSHVEYYEQAFKGATILGDLIYDETVSSSIYSTFMKILADSTVEFPESNTSQKIYVGANTCGSDTDCLDAETIITNKGWVITRTTAN